MPNGNNLINSLEFESNLRTLSGDALTRFFAREFYKHCEREMSHSDRISVLEARDKKFNGAVGGIAGAIGAVVISLIDRYFPNL